MKFNVEWAGKTYSYDPEDITVRQGMVIKTYTGLDLKPWEHALNDGDVKSWQALMWLMKQMNGERTQIQTEDFPIVRFMNTFNQASQDAADAQAAEEAAEKAEQDGRPKDSDGGPELTGGLA